MSLFRNKSIKIILNYVLGPLVFCLLLMSIYRQLHRQPNWQHSLGQLWNAIREASFLQWALIFLMMALNWGLEARKWQWAIRPLQSIGFLSCYKAVFTGTTLAFFTPNRMGEYVGRILYIEEGKRLQAISLTIVCSLAQLLITILAGAGGLLYLRAHILSMPTLVSGQVFWMDALFYISLAAGCILTLFYFRLAWLVRIVEKIPRSERFVKYIRVLDQFDASILLRIASLSVVRYIVFIVQYLLLFRVFGVELNLWQIFGSISVVFLVLAIVPSIAVLSELGVRWKASIEIVQLFSTNTMGILATAFAVWCINLVIPALIGSLLLLNIRLFKTRSKAAAGLK